MGHSKKSDQDAPVLPPIDFHPVSNGEFSPRPPTRRALQAERMWRRIVEEKHRRLGLTRREFAEGACGMAAALYVLNVVACSSDSELATTSARDGGNRADGSGRTDGGGRAETGGSAEGGPAEGGPGYDVDSGMLEDADRARQKLTGTDFIFDVQTHVSTPLTPWTEKQPPDRALDFIKQIFVQSDTTLACVSGIPAVRDLGIAHVEAHVQIQAIIDRLGGPRLIFHGNADPELGPSELDFMAQMTDRFAIGAFKTYPFKGALRLDSDEVGAPFIEQVSALGVQLIAAHRGISGGGGYAVAGSPVDVVRAANKFPNVNFLVYHSGWEPGGDENHPYDPQNADPRGVDRMIRALVEAGIGPGGNVYAELGTTWYNVMTDPASAAHVLGKLLKHLGPERVLWGTDCVFNGVPQGQIAALRSFVIPTSMQQTYGYPALTAAVRTRIFGMNAAGVYGVDPAATRYVIANDDVENLKLAYLDDPRSVPLPDRREYQGPRTRREFLGLLARSGGPHA